MSEDSYDALAYFDAVQAREAEREELTHEQLDEVTRCPACGSGTKHTMRDMPFQRFVYRVFWCRTVLDFEGLHVDKKCDARVERERKRAEARERNAATTE